MHYRAVGASALTIAAAIGLVGCSNSTGPSDANTVLWSSSSSERPGMEAVAAAFTEQTGIDVEITVADTDNYQTTIRTQLSSGTGPDVLYVWAGDGNPLAMRVLADAGLVEDLSDYDFVSEIPEGFRQLTGLDGSTYTIPIVSMAIGAAYNEDLLAENGWSVPQTWSETLQLCADARGAGLSAFALAGATGWQTQLLPYALAATLVYGAEPDFPQEMRDGEATFADSAWVEVLDKQDEMLEAGCFQDDALGTAYEDALNLVATGAAVGSVQVGASLGAVAPDMSFTLAPLPATDDVEQTQMPIAIGASYGINAAAQNPEGARQLIEFLGTEEGQSLYAEAVLGIPALPAPSFTVDPALDAQVEYLEAGRSTPFPDQLWPNPSVQQTLFEVVQQVLAGDTDAVSGLARLDQAYAQGE